MAAVAGGHNKTFDHRATQLSEDQRCSDTPIWDILDLTAGQTATRVRSGAGHAEFD